MKLTIQKTSNPKPKYIEESKLGFGRLFTDHMFIMNYSQDKGWNDLTIKPFEDFKLSPACAVFHYAQEAFEGLKAYKRADNSIALFRPWDNIKRMNSTCDRICAPKIDEDVVLEALYELIRLDADWIPSSPGTSLYIRPTIIATDPFLGVHPSHEYIFYIILSPVGAYYANGLAPTKIYIETEYVRSTKGGTGFVKTGGNYAASLIASGKAEEKGCDQALWLDANERKYIEEVGSMNIFFKIGDELVTPKLTGSILPGITRDSVIALAKKFGIKVSERLISVDEIIKAHSDGMLKEVFGTGTAEVISPVGELMIGENTLVINDGKMGETTSLLYDTLTGIQNGTVKDDFGWTIKIL